MDLALEATKPVEEYQVQELERQLREEQDITICWSSGNLSRGFG